jgi:hypothetical protein
MLKKENLNENDEDLVSVITKTIIKKVNVSEPINEAKSKNNIACMECDEVSTEAAWKKNRGFCPKCKVSSRGVAEEKLPENTQLGEAFMRIKSKSAKDMVMDLKYALEIAERWAKGNDVDRNLLRGMEKTLSDQLKVLRSDIKTFNSKEDVPKEYMAEETQLDEYTATSEKSKFNSGYRAKLVNAQGKVTYLSQTAYKTEKDAEAAADYYASIMNLSSKAIDVRMRAYNKKNSRAIVEKLEGTQPEGAQLGEAVNVSYDRYVRVHGKKPKVSGRAPFMFTSKSMGAVSFDDDTEVLMTPTMTAADAQKLAKEWGKKHGHRTVYFMESLEKSIEDLKKKPNDEEELKESVKIKNNTKSSDFIKILRAIAKDDLDARQFLNKLADHIKKSYSNTISDKDIQSLKRIPALQRLWDDDTLDYVLISSGLDK